MSPTKFNPLAKKGFDKIGMSRAEAEADFLKLDQTTPQTVTGGTPNLNLDNDSAPTGQADGYLAVVDDTLWYFAGSHRYKITATLDDPVVEPPVTGNPIGLLLCLTYNLE